MLTGAATDAYADTYEDEVKAVTQLQEVFQKAEKDHGIRVAPMLSAKSIQDLLDDGVNKKVGSKYLDNEMQLRTYRLYSDGFNLVTMTCPGAGDNKYLPNGINITTIFTSNELALHYSNDRDTAPAYDNKGKRVNSLKREFTYVMHEGKFIPLDQTAILDLSRKMFTENGPAEGFTTPLNSTQLDRMISLYHDVCASRF